MNYKPKVLIVENDQNHSKTLLNMLEGDYLTKSTAVAEKVLEILPEYQPDLVIFNISFLGDVGVKICKKIISNKKYPLIKILLLLDQTSVETFVKDHRFEVDGYLNHPYTYETLNEKVQFLTRLKRMEEIDLNKSETLDQLRSVVENTPLVSVIGFDQNGTVILWNKTCEQIYGFLEAETLGRRPRDFLLSGEIIRKFEDNFQRILDTQQAGLPREWSILTRTGERRWLYSSMFPIFRQGKIKSIFNMDVDMTRRIWAEEDRKLSIDKLRRALRGTIEAMALTVETRDPYTAGHQRRVADLAGNIASEMGLGENTIESIRLAGSLHDIGKIAVPAEILSKPRRLSIIEFELIKEHPRVGYDILKPIDFPWPLDKIVLQHHEHYDGSGYPQGLVGSNILIEASIITVADVVESISNHRPYRPSLGIKLALEEVRKHRGTRYNQDAVNACLKLFLEKGFAFDRGENTNIDKHVH